MHHRNTDTLVEPLTHVENKIEGAKMILKRLGLLGFMNHYNVETDSTVGGNYGLHDQLCFQIDDLSLADFTI